MQLARFTVALLATSALAALASCNPVDPRAAFVYGEQRARLDNGLRFVIMPDTSTSLVEVDVRYEVGSREDPPGKAGIAHLVEHMMFQQKPDGPETQPLMHAIGQLTTFFNAYTNWDTTHYMMQSRAEQLDALVKIESMRMFFRCQTISEEEFEREREVVRNEIRQRGGEPEGAIPHLVLDQVYPKGHAYGRMIGGDDVQLSSITLKDVCDFMDQYYTPDRATVIVAGGVSVEEAAKVVTRWFGALPKRVGAPRTEVEPVTSVTSGRAEYDLDIERNYVMVAWPLPPSNSPAGRAVRFGINRVFGETAGQAQEYNFAYSVEPWFLGGELSPVFGVGIELKGMDKLGEALEFVQKAAAKAHRDFEDVNWAQTDDYRKQTAAAFLAGMESLNARTVTVGDAVQFDADTDFDSSDTYLMNRLKRIQEFNGSMIARETKKALDWDHAKVIVFKANKTGLRGDKRSKVSFETKSHDKREIPEVDPREAKRPLKVAAEVSAFDKAERYTMNNGMRVVLLPIESPFPLMTALVMFNAGNAHSGEVPGLAERVAAFLNPPRDMDAAGRTGVFVEAQVSPDATYFTSSGLNIYDTVIVKGIERTITAGDFDQEQIERYQKRLREQYKRKDYQAEQEYRRQALNAFFGADHPYAKDAIMTPEDASRLGRDRMMDFKKEHYTAGNGTIIVVGKFDVGHVKRVISDTFGNWSRGHVDKPVDPTPRTRTGPEFIGVVGPENPQMTVTIAYPSSAGIDGQEAARRVLAEMINIRMADIRFKLGATYGTYGQRQTQAGPSLYRMGGGVDGARAGEALKAMRDGVELLRGGSTFDVDFVRARRSLIEDLLGQSTVTAELAGDLSTIAKYGLKPDFYKSLVKQVAAVSPAQVKMLLAQELKPETEIVLCFGDRPTLEQAFADAGIDQVKIVEPDYK